MRAARATTVALVLALLSGAGTAAVASPRVDVDRETHLSPEPTGPIHIDGDEEFTPGNGVRAGSGTIEDPYRIAGWAIVDRTQPVPGIHLESTQAHVVIEQIVVGEGFGAGIVLEAVANVTIRDVWIESTGTGIVVDRSENVTVQRADLQPVHPDHPARFEAGLRVEHSQEVRIENTTVLKADNPARIGWNEDVRIVDSRFWNEPGVFGENPSFGQILDAANEDLRIVRSEFNRTGFDPQSGERNLTFAYNAFRNGAWGIWGIGDEVAVHTGEFCGNTFEDMYFDAGLSLREAGVLRVVGNTFNDGDSIGVTLSQAEEITFERNHVTGFPKRGAAVTGEQVRVAHNAIHGNDFSAVNGSQVDARNNWWGHTSGPNISYGTPDDGQGPGEGEIVIAGKHVTFDPWLAQAPEVGPGTVDCGFPQGEPGVKERARLSGAVAARSGAYADTGIAGPEAEAQAQAGLSLDPFPLPQERPRVWTLLPS